MERPANASEEIRLRRTVRDLAALSALPAIWIGLGPEQIARSLADVLLNTLALDLVYLRLEGAGDEGVVEVARRKNRSDADALALVRTALASLLTADQIESSMTIPDPFGGGSLQVAVTRFGGNDDRGVL